MGEYNFLKWLFGVLFSGLGNTWVSKYTRSKGEGDNLKEPESDRIKVPSAQEEKPEDYKTRLGRRHLLIRANLLGLSDRQVANFYNFETVSELLDFEAGRREFPKKLLKSFCDFFFLKDQIFDLDIGLKRAFKTFSGSRDEIELFLQDGFRPVIACCPSDREAHLYCSIMMCKPENGFYRMILSSSHGRFRSGHGGKKNVEQLIHAMIKTGKDGTEARIVEVDTEQWSRIKAGKFYQNIENHDLDWDCQDIFDKWYFHYDKKFGNELRSQWMKEHQESKLSC